MKSRPNPFIRLSSILAVATIAFASSAHAEILSFDGNQATGVTTHTINATDWADYVGGTGTFNSANGGGRVYWRGSAGDGQYMHFDLSTLSGLTLVAPATVTLQDANPTWGGGVDGSFVATANSAWTAGTGNAVPGATAISNAVNATGGYGWDASISWGIGYTTFQDIVNNQGSFNGLAVIGGWGSQMHFDAGMNPYLTVQTGTTSSATGVITADTGASTWNASNYSFAATNAYSPVLNTLTITGELAAGTSGAGTVTINNGGTIAVNQAGGYNYYWAIDGTTINTGGKLTSNGHSNMQGLTLAGGELASTGTDGTWGGWGINGTTNVIGGATSTISAQQVTLSGGVFNVDAGSTLHFTGSTRGGSLTKNGLGTMKISGYQNYGDGTTINAGTLEVAGQNSGNGWLRGEVTVNTGGTLLFTGGDGTGFGWNSPVTKLTIDGGTFNAATGAHMGFGTYMTVALNNGGTITGAGQWNGDALLGFSSSGDSTSTISGSWNLRGDNGVNHTFTVADGEADNDLLVSANLSNIYSVALVKAGAGTMKLTGNSSYYGQTKVNEGTLVAASNTALGPGGWDGGSMTWVYDGATLALEGGISLDEHMHVFGAGVGGNGAIRSLSGNNALTLTYGNSGSGGGISIDSNTTIGVDADTLTAAGFYEDGGSWGLTKVGAGTLKLTKTSSYTGGTTVNVGTLELNSTVTDQSAVRGTLTVNSGATVNITGNDFAGLGRTGGANVTQLNVNGGTVNNSVQSWLTGAAVNLTGGTMNGTGTHNIISSSLNSKASATPSTISSHLNIRKDYGSSDLTIDTEDGTAATDLLISGNIGQTFGAAVTKTGAGTLELSGSSTYTGDTIVSAGTLLVNGALGDTAVSVASNATIGGSGTIGGTLSFGIDSFFDVFSAVVGNDPLAVTGTVTFGSGFGIDNLTGINWASVGLGTYTLISSAQDFATAGLDHWGSENAFSLGAGKSAYFQNGSLQLVVVPEPAAALLGNLGMLFLLRRRRS